MKSSQEYFTKLHTTYKELSKDLSSLERSLKSVERVEREVVRAGEAGDGGRRCGRGRRRPLPFFVYRFVSDEKTSHTNDDTTFLGAAKNEQKNDARRTG